MTDAAEVALNINVIPFLPLSTGHDGQEPRMSCRIFLSEWDINGCSPLLAIRNDPVHFGAWYNFCYNILSPAVYYSGRLEMATRNVGQEVRFLAPVPVIIPGGQHAL